MAVTSLLLAAVLLVYWWRSNHGHADTFTLGKGSVTESRFIAEHGEIVLEVTDHNAGLVQSQMQFYQFRSVLGYFLILPGFWLAIKVRSRLPRPPGAGVANTRLGAGRRRA